ncbi:MAG: PIN domain-containing protein [Deltaproteobacteria bacterium]|nr:PIN domain-containing protein [Deltaproteobacteria bacterium]MBF0510022.1 PIN domain-containing protein [Deltaproteobacteria bacterium]
MTTNYIIQADIVDITNDTPKAEDIFLIDTNVWYWITYTRASQSTRPPASYQITSYPAYYNSALAGGAKIFQSGLSLAELAHLIEKVEFGIFARANPTDFRDPNWFDKRYRHSFPVERSRVVAEIEAAWALIKDKPALPITIDDQSTEAALNRLQTERVDGYDLFILESMRTNRVKQVITDDRDFATVPGLQVFTANRSVINAARNQDKLLTR